jgi:tetratricopeptide (TPR) repeat protein
MSTARAAIYIRVHLLPELRDGDTHRAPARQLDGRRVCDGRFVVHGSLAGYAPLLNQILERLGRRVVDMSGKRQLVAFQAAGEASLQEVRDAAQRCGFERLRDEDLAVGYLWSDGLRRGIFQAGKQHLTVAKTAGEGQSAYADETPPDVEELLASVPPGLGVQSLSTVVEESHPLVAGIDLEELEARVDRMPHNVDGLRLLTEVLASHGRLKEARKKARAAVALVDDDNDLWRALGRIELGLDHPREAAVACERALALDPTDRYVLFFASVAYDRLGDRDRSAGASARLAALGGIG